MRPTIAAEREMAKKQATSFTFNDWRRMMVPLGNAEFGRGALRR
jgi:hypothetical protein